MKKVPAASPETLAAYQALAEDLSGQDVVTGSLFGMPALKCNNKAFAGLFGDAVVFKLAGEAHLAALALKGAKLFDPSGMKRPMKAWVVVPKAHRKQWKALARKALVEASSAG